MDDNNDGRRSKEDSIDAVLGDGRGFMVKYCVVRMIRLIVMWFAGACLFVRREMAGFSVMDFDGSRNCAGLGNGSVVANHMMFAFRFVGA
jgi:hypothetical protein